jgi:hypothetical protein
MIFLKKFVKQKCSCHMDPNQVHPNHYASQISITQKKLNENWKKTLIIKMAIKIQAPPFYSLDFNFFHDQILVGIWTKT